MQTIKSNNIPYNIGNLHYLLKSKYKSDIDKQVDNLKKSKRKYKIVKIQLVKKKSFLEKIFDNKTRYEYIYVLYVS